MTDIRSYLFDDRLTRANYRGAHLAQHNRLPEHKLVAILASIHEVVGADPFAVPPGDDPGIRLAGFDAYYSIVAAINNHGAEQGDGVSATFNSLKKNHFPNLADMGLLERFGPGGVPHDGGRMAVQSARLSPAALQVLQAGARVRAQLLGEAVERSLGEFADHIYELLKDLGQLSVYEVMLVASDLDLTLDAKRAYIRRYRLLKPVSRIQLHKDLQAHCDATSAQGLAKRAGLRDWHNWWNEARQIVTMLKDAHGLVVYNDDIVMLRSSPSALAFSPTRSEKVKNDALLWHDADKQPGWELHHICPIAYATCAEELKLIDSVENLLYVPQASHRRVPSRDNRFVKLEYDAANVLLTNPVATPQEQVLFVIPREVLVRPDRLDAMVAYNEKLLSFVV